MTYVPPSILKTAFNCPHCGALAQQSWKRCMATTLKKGHDTPSIFRQGQIIHLAENDVPEERLEMRKVREMLAGGRPTLLKSSDSVRTSQFIGNLHLSVCFNCCEATIWRADEVIWPSVENTPPPNVDMPDSVKSDYLEASSILQQSPRGAAALLRLAVEKLCETLGHGDKGINDAIGALVRDGLNPKIQKALDVVRVVGNEAVHPGVLDLKDDRETAASLFSLINIIVDSTISEKRQINEMFASLPEAKLEGIARRNKR